MICPLLLSQRRFFICTHILQYTSARAFALDFCMQTLLIPKGFMGTHIYFTSIHNPEEMKWNSIVIMRTVKGREHGDDEEIPLLNFPFSFSKVCFSIEWLHVLYLLTWSTAIMTRLMSIRRTYTVGYLLMQSRTAAATAAATLMTMLIWYDSTLDTRGRHDTVRASVWGDRLISCKVATLFI